MASVSLQTPLGSTVTEDTMATHWPAPTQPVPVSAYDITEATGKTPWFSQTLFNLNTTDLVNID